MARALSEACDLETTYPTTAVPCALCLLPIAYCLYLPVTPAGSAPAFEDVAEAAEEGAFAFSFWAYVG